MPKLRALSDDKAISAIPVDEPVLVELEPPATGADPEGDDTDVVEKPEKEKPAKPDADAGAKVLQTQMEEMRKANERLAREADEARREAREARSGQADTEADLIANALQAAQREEAAAEQALQTAFDNGDSKALAEAQKRMGRASADIREYERAAAVQAQQADREKNAPVQRHAPTDIIATIETMQIMPAEKVWLKEHSDAILDPNRKVELDAAYFKATRQGIIRGTPAYFKFLESEMGYTTAQTEDNDEGNTMTAAPVSRDNRSSQTGRVTSPNQVYLSPAEREQAKLIGVSDKAYAMGKQKMEAEKRSNPEKYARA
jgi:hypothetical protein